MPVAAMLSGAVHQALDLALGEIASLDCQVYGVWRAFLGCRFHADKLCLRASYCIGYTRLLNSQSIATALGIAAHRPMLVPLDEWAQARPPRLKLFSFLVRPPGGDFWISEKLVWPLLQKLG